MTCFQELFWHSLRAGIVGLWHACPQWCA